jgi:dCMP deaminase
MHDGNPASTKRNPPLIVLGLTGPVGSGCTTVGRIFSRSNDFDNVLSLLKWVNPNRNGGFGINWKGLNKEIDIKYEKLTEVREALRKYDEYKKSMDVSKLKREGEKLVKKVEAGLGEKLEGGFTVRKELKELEERVGERLSKNLEIREEIKALEELKAYHAEKTHLFVTLSVSDLIVFRTLMEIEKTNFNVEYIKESGRKKNYEEFIGIARKHMNSKKAKLALRRAGSKGYKEYYRGWYEYKSKDELKKLGRGFYDIHKVAGIIKREFYRKHPYEYSEVMQDFGDNIRRCDDPFGKKKHQMEDTCYRLAKGLAQMIYLLYKTKQGAFFVVDCLRNPYEVIYLRREFANFYLLSLYADSETRRQRVIDGAAWNLRRKLTDDEIAKIRKSFEKADERDSGKGIKGDTVLYKQNVTKCVQISDIAISNERKWSGATLEETEEGGNIFVDFCMKPLRILCLILSPGCTKPNNDEMFMNMAYTMAVKSNCISREVGAVIVGPKGYVVGAGWNDVGQGKISCGLRAFRDLRAQEFKPLVEAIKKRDEESTEDIIGRLTGIYEKHIYETPEQFCFCFKDEMVKRDVTPRLVRAWHKSVDELIEELKSDKREELQSVSDETFEVAKELGKNGGEQMIKKIVEEGDLHQLEYCLALHAEENAIIQSSKIGGMGLKGGTIYTTAQPCPLCAKKIQQIGLRKVVYTEAYPQSLSEVYMMGVDLEQFEGVKPRAYVKLFMPHHDQKEWQELESRNLVPRI